MNSKSKFQNLIHDISGNPYLRSLTDYPGHKFFNNNGGRLKHSYSVAWLSYNLAKRLNLDPVIAARAGLLHDIGYVHEEAPFPNILRHACRGAARARELGDIIKKLSSIPQTIVVTHDKEFENAADRLIIVEKVEGVSQVRYED